MRDQELKQHRGATIRGAVKRLSNMTINELHNLSDKDLHSILDLNSTLRTIEQTLKERNIIIKQG